MTPASDPTSRVMWDWSAFASTDAMKQLIEMGMEDGAREAMGQIDGIITDPA